MSQAKCPCNKEFTSTQYICAKCKKHYHFSCGCFALVVSEQGGKRRIVCVTCMSTHNYTSAGLPTRDDVLPIDRYQTATGSPTLDKKEQSSQPTFESQDQAPDEVNMGSLSKLLKGLSRDFSSFTSQFKKFTEDQTETNASVEFKLEGLSSLPDASNTCLTKLEGIENNCCKFTTFIDEQTETNKKVDESLVELKGRVSTLETKLVTHVAQPSTSTAASPTAIVDITAGELRERQRRARNVIIANIGEQASPEADLEAVIKLFSNAGQYPRPSATNRLGAPQPDRPRLLRLIYTCEDDARTVLRASSHLKKKANINVRSDLTQNQLRCLERLRTELNNRREAGEANIDIRYVRGTPTIVDTSKNSEAGRPNRPPRHKEQEAKNQTRVETGDQGNTSRSIMQDIISNGATF